MAMTSTSSNGRAATRTGAAAAGTNALDDPNLLGSLVKSAKSAHSTLGRALDTTLSHQRFGGAVMQPSALTMNRLERERQLHLQQELQRACGDTSAALSLASGSISGSRKARTDESLDSVPTQSTTGLHIPALPTMAPSMTAAADDGTESLGGTKIGGADRGYVTLIGAVPTFATTRQIEDNYELISSFRAYRTDAQRVERQAALRDVSAPHPDLLEQLAPLLQQRDATRQPALVDVETLPYNLRQAYAQRQQHGQPEQAVSEDAGAAISDAFGAPEASLDAADEMTAPPAGTWSFTCQGRAAADRVKSLNYLPGQRQPVVGQYYVRHATVEPRVTGGYIAPQTRAGVADGGQPPHAGAGQGPEDVSNEEHRPEGSVAGDVDRNGNDAASVFGQTLRDEIGGSIVGRPGTDRGGDGTSCASQATFPPAHGENVKGTSMFLSRVPREMSHGTAAPDVSYWPYPDVRSSAKRTPCLVQLDVLVTQRRRAPLVSGVPSSVYDVCGDIAANQPRTVTMDRATGRGTHWYGRTSPPTNGEPLDVEQALLVTLPKERAATLPPRTRESGGDDTSAVRGLGGGAQLPVDTSVSVERNMDYPPQLMGDPARLAHVRDFGKVPSRAEREARVRQGITVAYQGDDDVDAARGSADDAREWTEARSRSAIIHARAPGHHDLHAPSPTELGDVPSLALTKPRAGCTTDLGKGCPRPAHMANLHDLTYDTQRGYAVTGGRVKGTPSIGKTVNRQQAGRDYSEGCGAKVMYNPTNYLAPSVKSVPDFEKQITKEHEFRGHRVQSERYTRLFPSAPGPGHYTVNFSQVE